MEKVAVCVRTKDAGRFLPEWIAYHHSIGVDELTLYDDNSVDKTRQVIFRRYARCTTLNSKREKPIDVRLVSADIYSRHLRRNKKMIQMSNTCLHSITEWKNK